MDEVEAINQTLADIQQFVSGRFEEGMADLGTTKGEFEKVRADLIAVQEKQRKIERDSIVRATEGGARLTVPSGKYAGMDSLDLSLLSAFAKSQPATGEGVGEWRRNTDEARAAIAEAASVDMLAALAESSEKRMRARFNGNRNEALELRQYEHGARPGLQEFHRETFRQRAAMDSTTSTSGDELVATLQARELWMDVNLQTLIQPLVPTIAMPSNPFNIPRQLGDVNFYPGTENIATTSTAPTTGRGTLTAYELVGQVPYSFTLEEDAIVAMMPTIRAGLVRNVAETLDDILLCADTTAANGINSDGATISASTAAKGHWLLGYDGIIHLPLVDNTGQAVDHNAAVSDDMFNEARSKLGKYGARPSELVWVMDVNTFIRAQSITQFRTMDKLGPNATLLTGMLGAVEGIPVVVSEEVKLADTDGKVTDAGNGTDTGRLLIFNRTQWYQGFRREMTIDVDRDTQKRQTVVTVSFRHALTERSGTRSSATHTALIYDITGVS